MKKPFVDKKTFKKRSKSCQICGETNYSLLDVHRWGVEGKDGGKYNSMNCVCACVKCHRLIHSEKIHIIGIFNSTAGKLLNYTDESGKEHFNEI
jgi:hypothetical protein